MSNHFHGIISTPDSNISDGMSYFMREVSRSITQRAGRINQTFGGPYHWCILDTYRHYINTYKYTYRDPVEAKLALRCEEYPFSSLHGLLGFKKLNFVIQEDTLLFNPSFDPSTLVWLNEASQDDTIEVRKALKKPYFRFEKFPETGKYKRDEDFVF